MRQGDVAWLPAAIPNRVQVDKGSLLLPLGSKAREEGESILEPLVQNFSDDIEDYLLHTCVANYSRVRPMIHDPTHIVNVFLARVQRSLNTQEVQNIQEVQNPQNIQYAQSVQESLGARSVLSESITAVLQGLQHNPSDRRSLAEWAREFHCSARFLGEEFVRVMGEPFPVWRSGLRMTAARQQLENGSTVAQVAQELGYASASAFSTVFTRRHGISPGRYKREGWRHTVEHTIVR